MKLAILLVVVLLSSGCGGGNPHDDTAKEGKAMEALITRNLPAKAKDAWNADVSVSSVGCVFNGDKGTTSHTYDCLVDLMVNGQKEQLNAVASCDGTKCIWRVGA